MNMDLGAGLEQHQSYASALFNVGELVQKSHYLGTLIGDLG